MSQLNFTALSEPENQLRHRNAKQFGASGIPRSTIKKTALADVKNILAQKTVHSGKKPLTSATKSSISKKNLFDVFNDKENDCKNEIKKDSDQLPMEAGSCGTSHSVLKNESDSATSVGFVQTVCSFCNNVEDDYADILMKSLTLTKSEIDRLALEWERPPVVGIDDMWKIEIPAAIPNEMTSVSDWSEFDYEVREPDISLLNDIPAVEDTFDSVCLEE